MPAEYHRLRATARDIVARRNARLSAVAVSAIMSASGVSRQDAMAIIEAVISVVDLEDKIRV